MLIDLENRNSCGASPVNLSTLWLRILGRDKVQETAIKELKSLSDTNPYRDDVLELIYNLLSIIEANRQKGEILAKEEQDFLMKLSPIYLQRLEGKKLEGQVETFWANIISILEKRFQTVPSQLVAQINRLEDTAKLQQLLLETISVNSLAEFESLI